MSTFLFISPCCVHSKERYPHGFSSQLWSGLFIGENSVTETDSFIRLALANFTTVCIIWTLFSKNGIVKWTSLTGCILGSAIGAWLTLYLQ